MPSFNKVIVMGNLTRDPEVRQVGANAVKVCRFALALNERRRDRNGNMVDIPTFVEVDAWEKLAELCGQYLRKGRSVLVEGRLQMDSWEKDGQKHQKLNFTVTARMEKTGKRSSLRTRRSKLMSRRLSGAGMSGSETTRSARQKIAGASSAAQLPYFRMSAILNSTVPCLTWIRIFAEAALSRGTESSTERVPDPPLATSIRMPQGTVSQRSRWW